MPTSQDEDPCFQPDNPGCSRHSKQHDPKFHALCKGNAKQTFWGKTKAGDSSQTPAECASLSATLHTY